MGFTISANPRKNKIKESWQIRLNEKDFSDWLIKQSSPLLFFDGATKGNLGKAGAGGVIKNNEGIVVHRFTQGLDHSTSIQAEALALLQGLMQVKNLGIKDLVVVGDSQSIIKCLVNGAEPKDINFSRLIKRINAISKTLQKVTFFHVLRENNKDADLEANKVALLPAGSLLQNGHEDWAPIPQIFLSNFSYFSLISHVFLHFITAIFLRS